MAENVQITPGTGVTIGADSVTDITLGSAQIQYIKIMDGTIGGTNKAEVTANGLAVDGSGVTQPISAVSLPLPSGASTSANQATEISYLSTIATNTANAGTPTVSGTVTVIQPTAANLNATVTQTIAGNLVTEAWINDGSGNAISSTGGSLNVDVTNTVSVTGTVTSNQGTSPWVISGTVAATQSGTWNIGTLTSITNPVAVTGTFFQATQPISAVSLPLPTGAATAANQTNASQKTQIVDGSGNVIASTSNALNVDVTNFPATTAVTQSTSPWVVSLASTTITGTVIVAGNLTHNNAAPAANNVGVLPAVASSATPTYNAGDQVLLSTDLSGNLRVTIDGTVTEQNVNLNQVGGSAISIGQATMAASLPVVIASNQSSIPVTLTSTTITGTVAVTQSTSPWVISGTVTSNVGTTGGLALNTTLINGTQETQIVDGSANVIGPVQTISGTNYLPVVLAASGSTGSVIPSRTVQIGGSDGTDLRTFKVSATGVLSVDGSAVTQPISGTVTSNQGTAAALAGAWPVEITDGTNVLGTSSHPVRIDPTGTTTQPVSLISTTITGTVAVTQSGTWTVQPGNTANTTPWLSTISQGGNSATVTASNALKVDGSAVTQPVSGTVTANQGGAPWSQNITQIAGSSIATAATGIAKVGLTDGSGTAITSTLDSATSNQNLNIIRPDVMMSGSLGSLNAALTGSQQDVGSAVFVASGTWVGTIVAEGSGDNGTTWTLLSIATVPGGVLSTAGISANGQYRVAVLGGYNQFRLRMSAYTSGSASIIWNLSGVVAYPLCFQPNAANFKATVNLQDGSGNSLSSNSGALDENLTQVGGVAVVATAKATQASDFIPVQQPKDAGREYITLTADAIAGVTSETLITFTLNKQGTTTATQTNYTPTSGKTLRIQAIMIDVQSGAGAGGWVRVKLRHNTAGATTTSSALVFTAGSGTTNATAIASGIPVPIPDGLEIFGDGTQTIGITHLSSAITTVESITLVGYEY